MRLIATLFTAPAGSGQARLSASVEDDLSLCDKALTGQSTDSENGGILVLGWTISSGLENHGSRQPGRSSGFAKGSPRVLKALTPEAHDTVVNRLYAGARL